MYYYIIAIDFGYKNIGLAITQNKTYIVKPLKCIKINNEVDWIKITKEINKWCPKIVILSSNTKNKLFSKKIKKFYNFLIKTTKNIIFFLQDETLTTQEARYIIKNTKKNIHSYCAKLILQDWLLKKKITNFY